MPKCIILYSTLNMNTLLYFVLKATEKFVTENNFDFAKKICLNKHETHTFRKQTKAKKTLNLIFLKQ